MFLYLLLIVAFGLLILVSIGMVIYSLVKRRKSTLITAVLLFSIGTAVCIFSAYIYSKKALEYVRSEEFQEDARKGSQLAGETMGSVASGITGGVAKTLDDEAIKSMAGKSASILSKVTKTVASNLDSTLGTKNIFLDTSLEDSGLEPGRAEEKSTSKASDLSIFIDYTKDFNKTLRMTNYDQMRKKIDVADKRITAKAGQGKVEVFSFSHSESGITTYYILSAAQ